VDPSGHETLDEYLDILDIYVDGDIPRGGGGGGGGRKNNPSDWSYDSFIEELQSYDYLSLPITNMSTGEILDEIQVILDSCGLVPGIGEPIDAVNALISLGRGDLVAAAFSLGAIIPVAGAVSTGLKWGYKTGEGFSTFRQLKKAVGSPGDGNVWHHIVEQCQIDKSGFDPKLIQNTDNVLAVDKATHAQISGYYNSIDREISSNMRIREFLKGQPFDVQRQFGETVLKRFGVRP
jgi:hypothetical protein